MIVSCGSTEIIPKGYANKENYTNANIGQFNNTLQFSIYKYEKRPNLKNNQFLKPVSNNLEELENLLTRFEQEIENYDFKDKYDIRDKVIASCSNKLFADALDALNNSYIQNFEDQIIFVINHILDELNKKTFLTVELGLQSMHEKTLSLINRGHDLKSFESMVKKLQQRKINVVVHIINGLPHETKEDMINTAKYLNSLNIDGIKIHMLYILKNTKLADMFNKGKFHILTKEEYIDIVCDQLTYLNENIVIHRITGDPKIDDLIEPKWLVKKFCVLNDIDKEMKKRNIYQGKNC